MKTTTVAIAALIALLLGTNAWWLYRSLFSLDCGVTLAYVGDQLWNAENSLKQALAILPKAASGAEKEEVLSVASQAIGDVRPVPMKEGQVIVGGLLLTFDGNGKIVEAEAHSAPAFSRKYL